MSDVKAFFARLVRKDIHVHHVGAAFGVGTTSARRASATRYLLLCHLVVSYPGLAQDIAEVLVALVAHQGLLDELFALGRVDVEYRPRFLQYVLDFW